VLDRGLAKFIFPNATFIGAFDESYLCCKLNLGSNLPLGGTAVIMGTIRGIWDQLMLTIGEIDDKIFLTTDDYTFLSCGNTYNNPPDFLALFMPFTRLVWALIFLTIFGWPLVLSVIENDFNL